MDTFSQGSTGFGSGAGFVRRVTMTLTRGTAWLARALERRNSRLDLLEMTDSQLKDIGVTRREADNEGVRPFWS